MLVCLLCRSYSVVYVSLCQCIFPRTFSQFHDDLRLESEEPVFPYEHTRTLYLSSTFPSVGFFSFVHSKLGSLGFFRFTRGRSHCGCDGNYCWSPLLLLGGCVPTDD